MDNKEYKFVRIFFLSTLGIGEQTVYSWINKTNDQGMPSSPSSNTHTGEKVKDKRIPEGVNKAMKYLAELPKMESHYCRQSTNKNT